MHKEKDGISFSQVMAITSDNLNLLTNVAGLYMICKKDKNQKNQVIFAGVSSNLKDGLLKQLENYTSHKELSFCYTPTSAKTTIKNSQKPLYERVA